MAENPATWGRAEKIISDTLDKAQAAHEAGMCGWSTPKQIAEALKMAGLLRTSEDARRELLEKLQQKHPGMTDPSKISYTRCTTCGGKDFTIQDDEFVCAGCGDILG